MDTKVPFLFKKEERRQSQASQAELCAQIWYFSFLNKNVTLFDVQMVRQKEKVYSRDTMDQKIPNKKQKYQTSLLKVS